VGAETRRQVYLIFKEAIRNALRHGRPKNVVMRLAVSDDRLEAEIRDDGQGIPLDRLSGDAEDAIGYGLGTMRRRAESLGGVFHVSSGPAEGTRIIVEVPLRRRA
jgi:signal transduction histidine kinase